ncbi:choice-of-anchor W domain-containing protein [Roseococcus sp. DSY-14]|uniref:choice-of-anchor W domain-containing protein n=1 Tax=Roseococcus sp. DSY-14 TaxID=3369650 RepID=UPI00387B9BF6
MKVLPALLLAAAIGAGGAQAAPVITFTGSTDTAFLAFLAGRGVALPAAEAAVAQARGGNNAGNGDYEAGLHIPPNLTNAAPVGTAGQFSWGVAGGGNAFRPFSLARTGSTLAFTLGNYAGSWTNPLVDGIDMLGLRLRSEGAGSATRMRALALNGTALGGLLASGGGLDFAVVEGFGPGDFVLTGEAALDWTGGFPGGSRLGFQIKAIDAPTLVPGPAALALFGLGMLCLGLVRSRG